MARGGDMLAKSELQHQQRCFTFELKNPEPAINFLHQRMVTGEPCPHLFINEADPYSAAPEDLVRDLRHAPGKGGVWYLMSLASYCRSAQGGSKPRGGRESSTNRRREVHGANGEVCGFWHSDKIKQDVRDADRRIVGYTRTLYYKNKREATSSGWCMNEVWLQQHDGADQQIVLCKVYKLNSKRYTQPSTAASPEAAPVDQSPVYDVDDQMSSRVARAEAVAAEARDGGKSPVAVLPSMGNTATNLLLAAEKAVSCDFEKVCEIDEFVLVKELHLTTIDELGLDRSLLSGKNQGLLHKLEVRLQHVAMDRELTPMERDRIVSCGETMSDIIFSAYLNEVGKRARQAFNALQRIGVNVQDQVSKRASKVTNVSLVVDDSGGNQRVRVLYSASLEVEDSFVSKVEGEENESPVPATSSAAASSSGVKRKADHVHPEAPPSMRQERAVTEPSGPEETEPRLSSDNHSPTVGGNNGDLTEIFDGISDDNIPPVTGDHDWDPSMCYANMERILSEETPIGSDDWTKYLFGIVDDGGNWMLSGGNDGGAPSGVGAGVPEEDQYPVLPEQPDDAPAAS